eukprot:1195508-Prorocentrum_minimum.AAC.5
MLATAGTKRNSSHVSYILQRRVAISGGRARGRARRALWDILGHFGTLTWCSRPRARARWQRRPSSRLSSARVVVAAAASISKCRFLHSAMHATTYGSAVTELPAACQQGPRTHVKPLLSHSTTGEFKSNPPIFSRTFFLIMALDPNCPNHDGSYYGCDTCPPAPGGRAPFRLFV